MIAREANKPSLMTNSVQRIGARVKGGSVQNRLERSQNPIYLRTNHFRTFLGNFPRRFPPKGVCHALRGIVKALTLKCKSKSNLA